MILGLLILVCHSSYEFYLWLVLEDECDPQWARDRD